jgi:hypothetical protein
MAVALASNAARAIHKTIATPAGAGFKYLTTHGDLDVEHTKMFETLIDEISPQHMSLIIVSACDFYRLYGVQIQEDRFPQCRRKGRSCQVYPI